MSKIYKNRKLHGLKDSDPWATQIDHGPLSYLLARAASVGFNRVLLCGSLEQMSREYVEEPLSVGWQFDRQYVHRYRSPVYRKEDVRVSVKLASESWFPGCEKADDALVAWLALKEEWAWHTSLPLLSTPSKTGQALLWESLPKGQEFPALPDEVEEIVRRNSTQHRLQTFQKDFKGQRWCYDGRWMYASLATLDRLPVGEPVHWQMNLDRAPKEFREFVPGWYAVKVWVPEDWNLIGLVPVLASTIDREADGWVYPNRPGNCFVTWAAEPELTLAQQNGWKIEVYESYTFDKGRPLEPWAKKLITMRNALKSRSIFARGAVRQILNSTIGSLHSSGYEREQFIPDSEWKEFRRANAHLISQAHRGWEQVEGGKMVSVMVADESPLSIVMPHWSATIYALERARIAQYALRCDPASLIEIKGDAIYADRELPWHSEDAGNLGHVRFKGVSDGQTEMR